MTTPRTITRNTRHPFKMGNEDTNDDGLDAIRQTIDGTGDRILHHTTFDFGSKVLALTLQGFVLADTADRDDDGDPHVAVAAYNDLRSVFSTGHDREIRLVFQDGNDVTYRMGDAPTVASLRSLIRAYHDEFLRNGDPQLWGDADEEAYDNAMPNGSASAPDANNSDESIRIGERVRFWQEQDRINQALIPRVVA